MRADTRDERDERLAGVPFGASERVEEDMAAHHRSPKVNTRVKAKLVTPAEADAIMGEAHKVNAKIAKSKPPVKIKTTGRRQLRIRLTLTTSKSVAETVESLGALLSTGGQITGWDDVKITRCREVKS